MSGLNLVNIDLNLLVCFDALMVETSVSRAASRMGLSQPAMSRALRRLRELFNDKLLQRTADGMVPTPVALELARLVQPHLAGIAQVLGQNVDFDPFTTQRRFVLALPDLATFGLLPLVVREVNVLAPGVELIVRASGNTEALQFVLDGQVEMAVGVYDHLPPMVCSQNLRTMREVCIADARNPLIAREGLTLNSFLALPHARIVMNKDHGTPIDTALETLGMRRRVAVTTPYFLSIPAMVAGTNMLAVVQEELLDLLPRHNSIVTYPLPFPFEPVMTKLIWHVRNDRDRGHAWLRKRFTEEAPYAPRE